jgi:crossover junction endodeoxyribonuclease RuvC
MSNPVILSLDASSVTIGWVLWDGAVRDQGTVKLTGADIADRCRQAFASVGLMIETHPDIDVVALESPVWRFANSTLPQCHVQGAVMARVALFGLHVVSVSPAAAKRTLTGHGNADKLMMQRAAACYGVTGEHASDALAIALSASTKVYVPAEEAA